LGDGTSPHSEQRRQRCGGTLIGRLITSRIKATWLFSGLISSSAYAKTTFSPRILESAKRGAEHRYQELKAQIESLVKLFPHLQGHSESPLTAPVDTVKRAIRRRRRRKMSEAARKAVSERMTKFWAHDGKPGSRRLPSRLPRDQNGSVGILSDRCQRGRRGHRAITLASSPTDRPVGVAGPGDEALVPND
jgi:hypothetical protein